jgi:hypothetical protein
MDAVSRLDQYAQGALLDESQLALAEERGTL